MALQSVSQLLAARDAAIKKPVGPQTAVERLVADKKTEVAKAGNYFKSESYFRAQANRLNYMIAVYGNLGLANEKAAMEAEAQKLIKEYVKLYGVPKTGTNTNTSA